MKSIASSSAMRVQILAVSAVVAKSYQRCIFVCIAIGSKAAWLAVAIDLRKPESFFFPDVCLSPLNEGCESDAVSYLSNKGSVASVGARAWVVWKFV